MNWTAVPSSRLLLQPLRHLIMSKEDQAKLLFLLSSSIWRIRQTVARWLAIMVTPVAQAQHWPTQRLAELRFSLSLLSSHMTRHLISMVKLCRLTLSVAWTTLFQDTNIRFVCIAQWTTLCLLRPAFLKKRWPSNRTSLTVRLCSLKNLMLRQQKHFHISTEDQTRRSWTIWAFSQKLQ